MRCFLLLLLLAAAAVAQEETATPPQETLVSRNELVHSGMQFRVGMLTSDLQPQVSMSYYLVNNSVVDCKMEDFRWVCSGELRYFFLTIRRANISCALSNQKVISVGNGKSPYPSFSEEKLIRKETCRVELDLTYRGFHVLHNTWSVCFVSLFIILFSAFVGWLAYRCTAKSNSSSLQEEKVHEEEVLPKRQARQKVTSYKETQTKTSKKIQ